MENFGCTVTGRERIASNLLRVRFEVGPGDGVGYVPIVPGDEAVVFAFPGGEPGADAAPRNYTVRSYDPRANEMVVDIAEHPHGPAVDWFRTAEPGTRVPASGPRSWYSPPAAGHHVLAGDLAALPALARILEQTPSGVEVTVLAEVLAADELDYLPARANTVVVPLVGSGNGVSPTRLADALADLEFGDDAYCWFSGEAAATRAAKKQLRGRGWSRDRYDVVGYWREDAERWSARFEQRSDELLAVYTGALADGRSAEEATDLYEEALERAGL
ncbi:siderophore-interacting protein [Rhodococcus rhodnii]|nr:siderophore-interacting protein [Rhodococcus rhodnii]TXG89849.1 siderophore-interacting protein [Rhodococcus rhodnii]